MCLLVWDRGTESKTQKAAHEKLVQKCSPVGGAQKEAWEGCEDMGRRTDQWVQQSSTASSQREKVKVREYPEGPLFRAHMIVSATEIHFAVAHIFQKTVK